MTQSEPLGKAAGAAWRLHRFLFGFALVVLLSALESWCFAAEPPGYYATAAGKTGPAHAEAPLCTSDTDSWEPPASIKGDLARSIFYMAIRYTGDKSNEPALHLTDNSALIKSTNSYMGKLSTLLAWHKADPVSADE